MEMTIKSLENRYPSFPEQPMEIWEIIIRQAVKRSLKAVNILLLIKKFRPIVLKMIKEGILMTYICRFKFQSPPSESETEIPLAVHRFPRSVLSFPWRTDEKPKLAWKKLSMIGQDNLMTLLQKRGLQEYQLLGKVCFHGHAFLKKDETDKDGKLIRSETFWLNFRFGEIISYSSEVLITKHDYHEKTKVEFSPKFLSETNFTDDYGPNHIRITEEEIIYGPLDRYSKDNLIYIQERRRMMNDLGDLVLWIAPPQRISFTKFIPLVGSYQLYREAQPENGGVFWKGLISF